MVEALQGRALVDVLELERPPLLRVGLAPEGHRADLLEGPERPDLEATVPGREDGGEQLLAEEPLPRHVQLDHLRPPAGEAADLARAARAPPSERAEGEPPARALIAAQPEQVVRVERDQLPELPLGDGGRLGQDLGHEAEGREVGHRPFSFPSAEADLKWFATHMLLGRSATHMLPRINNDAAHPVRRLQPRDRPADRRALLRGLPEHGRAARAGPDARPEDRRRRIAGDT
eukprot:XP_001707485.1 Hypothetical protein GL50803_34153 [Giardia lamblia ATCC 50803]